MAGSKVFKISVSIIYSLTVSSTAAARDSTSENRPIKVDPSTVMAIGRLCPALNTIVKLPPAKSVYPVFEPRRFGMARRLSFVFSPRF